MNETNTLEKQKLKTELGGFIAVRAKKKHVEAFTINDGTCVVLKDKNTCCDTITLDGNYKILGFSDNEEVARQVVFGIEDRYRSYTDFFRTYNTAVDSLSSLLKSEGVFTKNPFRSLNGAKLVHSNGNKLIAEAILIKAQEKYDEAQSKIWTGKILILKKTTL